MAHGHLIRDATPADHAAIRMVVAAAFGRTAEADLIEALRASGDAVIDMIAERDGKVVGHVLMSALQMPEGALALAPVAVAPPEQNRGIGAALIRTALTRASSEGWQAVFVLGEPAYYTRFGFETSLAETFDTAYPKAFFMATELQPAALAGRSGPVVYAAPFLDLA